MSRTHVPAELRRLVRERAGNCCEYCLIPQSATFASHTIDHILAEKHGGLTSADNLAWACAVCNGLKGSDLASLDDETGVIVSLFHPRRDQWAAHFRLDEGRIAPLTAVGRVTVRLLHLNHADRIEERQMLLAAGVLRAPLTR